jgi:hypothetical protein
MPEHQHPKLIALGSALEELQRAVDLPQEARYAVQALRANLDAKAVFLDATSAILIAKMIRGLASTTTLATDLPK